MICKCGHSKDEHINGHCEGKFYLCDCIEFKEDKK